MATRTLITRTKLVPQVDKENPPTSVGFLFVKNKYNLMSKYQNRFGNLIFSVGEQEIVDYLIHNFGQTFTQAVDHVCKQKRDLSIQHRRMGNNALADQILREIGELK